MKKRKRMSFPPSNNLSAESVITPFNAGDSVWKSPVSITGILRTIFRESFPFINLACHGSTRRVTLRDITIITGKLDIVDKLYARQTGSNTCSPSSSPL